MREYFCKHIPSTKCKNRLRNNIITADIETYTLSDGTFIPYSIGFYDGLNTFTYYLSDYNNSETMIYTMFKQLFKSKYCNKIVYLHNLSKFDGYFILNTLRSSFGKDIKINIIKKEDKLISITIFYGPNFIYNIKIQDSYLLLPFSFNTLCNKFNTNIKKSIFPYKFVKSYNLDYFGPKTTISFYCSFWFWLIKDIDIYISPFFFYFFTYFFLYFKMRVKK